MYDTSKDKIKERCQTVDKLDEYPSKGDELLKCGHDNEINIFSRVDSVYGCADGRNLPCDDDNNKGKKKKNHHHHNHIDNEKYSISGMCMGRQEE